MSASEYDYLIKVIVCGDKGVGKNIFLTFFAKRFFEENYKLTIDVDFYTKTIDIQTKDGIKKCRLQIWELGGTERFSSVRPMYYRGALGAILIFDLTYHKSFDNLPNWIIEIWEISGLHFPILLVGNKTKSEKITVTPNEINDLIYNYNLNYLEASIISKEIVSDIFYSFACLILGVDIKSENLLSKGINFRLAPINFKGYKHFLQIFEVIELDEPPYMITKQIHRDPFPRVIAKELIDDEKVLILIDHDEKKIWIYHGSKSTKQIQMFGENLAKKFRKQNLFLYRICNMNEYKNNNNIIQKLLNQWVGPGTAKPITRENFNEISRRRFGYYIISKLTCNRCGKKISQNIIDGKISFCPYCGFKIENDDN